MLRHVAGRILQAVVTTFGVLTLVFFLMRLSGDPTLLLVPQGASAEQIAELRHELGFDRPLIVHMSSIWRSSRMAISANRWCSACRHPASSRPAYPIRWSWQVVRCW